MTPAMAINGGRRSKPYLVLALFVAVLAVSFVYVLFGEYRTDVSSVLGSLFGSGDSATDFVVKNVRLPRLVIVLCVGMSLAVCGVFLQGIFRNPLAEPSILGISQAAALGAVISIAFDQAPTQLHTSIFSAVFAIGATFLFVLISRWVGDFSHSYIIITGVSIGLLSSAVISLLIYLTLPFYETSKQILYWLMGQFEGKGWEEVIYLAPVTVAGSVYLLYHSEVLNVMTLDDVQASSLGLDIVKVRYELLFVIAVMIAACSSVVGTIAFIGLIVPHVVRQFTGAEGRNVVAASLAAGPLLLLVIDLLSRTVFAPYMIQAGTVSSLIGAPFVIMILMIKRSWL